MKGLSIKKLAAVATGAALIGTALAPIASALTVTQSDIFTDKGAPKVNIVVGTNAQLSDAVWAGNIAAKIAEKAGSYETVAVSGAAGGAEATVDGISVDLLVGGTVSYTNAKVYKSGESDGTLTLDSYSSTNEFPDIWAGDSQLAHLWKDNTASIKYAGTNYTRVFAEYIGVGADVAFDYAGEGGAADLEMYISGENDLNYTIALGTGIPGWNTGAAGYSAHFLDGTTDNMKIPFFGEEYLVREVDLNSTPYLKLIKEAAIETVSEGETITGLKGKGNYDGQEMSVKIVSLVQSGAATTTYSVKAELYDQDGTKVDTRTVAAGTSLDEQFVDSKGEYALGTILYIERVDVGSTTGVGTIDLTKGTNMVQLYDGKGYPYDATDTSGIYDYKVKLITNDDSGSKYLTNIIIGNAAERWTNSSATNGPLYAPSAQCLTEKGKEGPTEIEFLSGTGAQGEGYATVAFDGLEQDEAITVMKFQDNSITYIDSSDATHTIPLYIELTKVTSGASFTFDGRTLYYATDTNDNYFDVNGTAVGTGEDGWVVTNNINGVAAIRDVNCTDIVLGDGTLYTGFVAGDRIDINGALWTLQDMNTNGSGDDNSCMIRINADLNFTMATSYVTSTSSQSGVEYLAPFTTAWGKSIFVSDGNKATDRVFTVPIQMKGRNDVTFDYYAYTDPTAEGSYLWLLLAGTTNFTPQYSKDIWFTGTDYAERGAPHVSYYWRDAEKFGGASDSLYYLAQFGIDTNEDGYPDANIFYDTYTNKLFAFPNTNLSVYDCDVNYHGEEGTTRAKWCLDEDPATTGKSSAGYGDFGEKYILSGGELTISIPENIARAQLVLKGKDVESTLEGADTLTVKDGETGTTSGGTSIKVDKVTYTAVCGAEGGTCAATPSKYFAPAKVANPLVYLDVEAPFGANIIVGGPIVNQLAAAVTGLADRLTAPGDTVAEVDATSGDIIVAGYTASDTGKAAQQLIDAIDALEMK